MLIRHTDCQLARHRRELRRCCSTASTSTWRRRPGPRRRQHRVPRRARAAPPSVAAQTRPSPHDDLFLLIFTSGSTGLPEGGALHPGPPSPGPGVHVASIAELDRRRRRVRAVAVLPRQLAVHRLGLGAQRRHPVRDPTRVLGLEHAARHPPLRRDDDHLHGQGPELHPGGHPSNPTTPTSRCGSPSATRRRVVTSASSPAVRLQRARQLRRRPRASSSSAAIRRCPQGALGHGRTRLGEGPRPRHAARSARRSTFGADGRPTNLEEAVGEIVETEPTERLRGLLPQRGSHQARASAAAGTGPATSPTATPTAGCSSPAAPTSGCGSTARTSPPRRSRRSSAGIPTCVPSPSTPCPTTPSAIG